ncbi:MAG: right-handed parallel beta-helix repeat-containing protein [Bacteroidia bacterium]
MKISIKKPSALFSLKTLATLALPAALFLSSCEKEPVAEPNPPVVTKDAIVLDHIKKDTTLEDRVADPDLPDYLVNQSIAVSASLTLKPGVVIAFAQDSRMEISSSGSIISKGQAAKKIKFTGQVAQRGYWSGIILYSNSSKNEFTHTDIVYGGSKPMLDNVKGALVLFEAARVSLTNATVSQSGGYGMYLRDKSILLTFANNRFTDNKDAPILLTAQNVPQLDAASIFTGNNGRNVIEVMGSYVDGTEEIIWAAFTDNTPYRLLGRITVRTGWKLNPGTTIEVAENEFIAIEKGYLNAIGTANKKITIHGLAKTTGSWNGLVFYSRSAYNIMEFVKISHAGGISLLGGTKASIALFGSNSANLSIRNSEISQSGGYGIHLFGKKAELNADAESTNSFTANTLAPVFIEE